MPLRYHRPDIILRLLLQFSLPFRLLKLCALVLSCPAFADEAHVTAHPVSSSNQLEELTSTEVRERLAAGCNTILIPVGATEQTGPYVALGKHNYRVRALADQIAQKLGKTLVAPVISYVPEGAINPPVAHMRYTGTISIPDTAFEAMLEGAARSFKQHGFRYIVLLGDHGGYKQDLDHVAKKLNREWDKDRSARVIYLAQYYQLSSTGFDAILKKRGYSDAEIGAHGGLSDTALTMAVDKSLVRSDSMSSTALPLPGVVGDPRRATPELGQTGVQLIVDGSVAALRAAMK